MIRFFQAHGYDPAPTARPALCGAISGALAAAAASPVLYAFGSLRAAETVFGRDGAYVTLLIVATLTLAGFIYGAVFRRAADDARAGWLLGMAHGFVVWVAAPITLLPLVGDHVMAAGRPATGFFAGFVLWGLLLGVLFPHIHKAISGELGARRREWLSFGRLKTRLLRRP